MKKYLLFITCLALFSCINSRKPLEKGISVYVGISNPYKEGNTTVWVNDTIVYAGKFVYGKNSDYYNEMFIGKIRKDTGIVKFKVKILDRDTTFFYKMIGVDSIAIGLNFEEDFFYVRDDKYKTRWMLD